jgi:hypothetical protein
MAATVVSFGIWCGRKLKPTSTKLLEKYKGADDEARSQEREYRHGPCAYLDSKELLGC